MKKIGTGGSTVAVRLSSDTIDQLKAYAIEKGIVNLAGKPGMSTIVRMLILEGLHTGLDERTLDVWNSARGMILREVLGRMHDVLGEYQNE